MHGKQGAVDSWSNAGGIAQQIMSLHSVGSSQFPARLDSVAAG